MHKHKKIFRDLDIYQHIDFCLSSLLRFSLWNGCLKVSLGIFQHVSVNLSVKLPTPYKYSLVTELHGGQSKSVVYSLHINKRVTTLVTCQGRWTKRVAAKWRESLKKSFLCLSELLITMHGEKPRPRSPNCLKLIKRLMLPIQMQLGRRWLSSFPFRFQPVSSQEVLIARPDRHTNDNISILRPGTVMHQLTVCQWDWLFWLLWQAFLHTVKVLPHPP